MQNLHNPYLGALTPELGQDEGDVSLAGPVILLLGLMGIGAALLFFKDRERNKYYDNNRAEPAIKRLRNVIADIESDDEDDDFDDEDDIEEFDTLED